MIKPHATRTTPRYDSDYPPYPTITTKRINIDSTEVQLKLVDFLYVTLRSGDIATSRYRQLKSIRGVFLVYDVTNRDSIKDMNEMISDLQRTFEDFFFSFFFTFLNTLLISFQVMYVILSGYHRYIWWRTKLTIQKIE